MKTSDNSKKFAEKIKQLESTLLFSSEEISKLRKKVIIFYSFQTKF